MSKFWIIYLIIFIPTYILSQEVPTALIDKISTGSTTSISFIVENQASTGKQYELSVQTSSATIIALHSKGQIQVNPQESKVFVVPLRITPETPYGTHTIYLELFDEKTKETKVQRKEITILEERDLVLTLIDAPKYVNAGDTIRAKVLVKNNGNVKENLALTVKNGNLEGSDHVELSESESKIITLYRITNPRNSQNEHLNLSLIVQNDQPTSESKTLHIYTTVISGKPEEIDVFHRFPIIASLNYLGMQNRGQYTDGFQGELHGRGSLDSRNKHILEFKAITKNPTNDNSLSQYEEYYIQYKNEKLHVHIGDKTYSSSFLTEYARYGRGIELKYQFNKINVSGFYNQPRFFGEIQEEYNVQTTYKISPKTELTAGYLYKKRKTESRNLHRAMMDSDSNLPYLFGEHQLTKHLKIGGEIAYSKTKEQEGTAYILSAEAQFKKINGQISYLEASPEFTGYFRNTQTINGNLQINLTKKIHLYTNFSQDAKNYNRDTLFMAAPYRSQIYGGLQLKYHKIGYINATGGIQNYEDRMKEKQFDYSEKYIRLSINQQIGIFWLNLESQFGETENHLTNTTGKTNIYLANLSFDKFRTNFNLFTSYNQTSRYQDNEMSQWFYGIRTYSYLSEKTKFSLLYQNNYTPEEYYKDRSYFEATLHQTLYRHHKIEASGRFSTQQGEFNKNFTFSLRYIWQINVPTQRTAQYVTLSGKIENKNGQYTPKTGLKLGNQTVYTDLEGNYTFKNVIPGEYFLEIDRSTLELNHITDIDLPVYLHLTEAENYFNFGITHAGEIRGKVQLTEDEFELAEYRPSKQKNKQASIIIEASNGVQTYRKIVNLNEEFDFTYLRPGNWKIKVYRNGLNKRYKIAVESWELELRPSEIAQISIPISKQETKIQFQESILQVGYNEIKQKK